MALMMLREQQTLEFQKGFFTEHNRIDLVKSHRARIKTIPDGVLQKLSIMLLAGKTLYPGRSDDPAIFQQKCSAVVIKGRDFQNPESTCPVIQTSKDGVDNRRNRRTLTQND